MSPSKGPCWAHWIRSRRVASHMAPVHSLEVSAMALRLIGVVAPCALELAPPGRSVVKLVEQPSMEDMA